MSEQRKKILEMLASGTINSDEAERLLAALESSTTNQEKENENVKSKSSPKFLHVKVEKMNGERHKNVDIKIPIILLKAGMKLGSMMPESSKSELNAHLYNRGFKLDLNSIDSKDLDAIMTSLTENSIDIDTENEKVQIFCA